MTFRGISSSCRMWQAITAVLQKPPKSAIVPQDGEQKMRYLYLLMIHNKTFCFGITSIISDNNHRGSCRNPHNKIKYIAESSSCISKIICL